MNKAAISLAMLRLLVRVYNQSIQSFYFFPEVILCNSGSLESSELASLLEAGFLVCTQADSFGKVYRLSADAEAALVQALHHRRRRLPKREKHSPQTALAFCPPL
jgi:hypothetical protein